MKESRAIKIFAMLFNSIDIALWILLAMFLNNWPLALFSTLFINVTAKK